MEPRNAPPTPQQDPPSDTTPFGSHDIFQDPALAETLKDDPLFLFLKKWWVQLLVFAGAIVLGVYAKGAFQDTYRAEHGRAADLFVELQTRFAELPGLQASLAKAVADESKAGDKKEDAAKKVSDARAKVDQSKARIDSVLSSLADTKEPYTELAQLYRGAMAVQGGDLGAASGALSRTNWASISDTKSSERFLAELAALVLARARLDSDAELASGRNALRELAEKGSFFDVAAALSLANISRSAEEKQEARTALEAIISRSPEQRDALNDTLQRVRE